MVYLYHDSYYKDISHKTFEERAQTNFDGDTRIITEAPPIVGKRPVKRSKAVVPHAAQAKREGNRFGRGKRTFEAPE